MACMFFQCQHPQEQSFAKVFVHRLPDGCQGTGCFFQASWVCWLTMASDSLDHSSSEQKLGCGHSAAPSCPGVCCASLSLPHPGTPISILSSWCFCFAEVVWVLGHLGSVLSSDLCIASQIVGLCLSLPLLLRGLRLSRQGLSVVLSLSLFLPPPVESCCWGGRT